MSDKSTAISSGCGSPALNILWFVITVLREITKIDLDSSNLVGLWAPLQMNRFVCVRNIDECFPTAEVFSLKYTQVRYSTAKYSTHTHTHARVLIYKPSSHQKRVRRLHYIRTLHMYKVGTQALARSLSLPRQPPPPPFQSAIGLGHAPPILNGKHMLNARARLCVLSARVRTHSSHMLADAAQARRHLSVREAESGGCIECHCRSVGRRSALWLFGVHLVRWHLVIVPH